MGDIIKMTRDDRLLPYTFYQPIRIMRLEEMLHHNEESTLWPWIIIVYDGHVKYCFQGRYRELHARSVLLWNHPDDFQLLEPNRIAGLALQYRPYGAKIAHDIALIAKGSSKLIDIAIALEKEARVFEHNHPFRLQKLFAELLETVYSELWASKQQQEGMWVQKVVDYISIHFHEDLTREQMATKAQVSPEHFSRVFRKHTGYTFSKYLTMLRIRASQKKLLYDMPKLDDLAQNVGYREGTYLSRKFKELVGISPKVYYQKPKRVITLNTNHTACLLALGIIPELGVFSPFIENIKTVPSRHKLIGYEHNVVSNYQEITAACPDVIINYNKGHDKQSLLALAPVVELPCQQLSWRDQFRLISNIVNRQERFGSWLQQYEEQILACNSLLDQQIGSRGTAIVWELGNNAAAYCIDSSYGRGSHILYEDLGFRRPDAIIAEKIEHTGFFTVELEEIAHYPADYIFITALPTNDLAKKRLIKLLHSEEWRTMEAVQKQRVYFINQYELFYGYDPLSTAAQLKELMKVLTS